MNVLSLFDGMSCGCIALNRAGIKVENYYAYEIDKYAIKISKKNYPYIKHMGDVFGEDFSKYKNIDILMGGSPCTHWSIANVSRTKEYTCGGIGYNLFKRYVDALNQAKPKYFIYENNYGIPELIKQAISKELKVDPIMINSALVSGQSRKRLYWTNIQGIEQPEDMGILLKDVLEEGITDRIKSYRIDASYYKGGNLFQYCKKSRRQQIFSPIQIGYIRNNYRDKRVYSVNGKSITLAGNVGGWGGKTGIYWIDLPDGNYFIRKLTPVEVERLQNVPYNFTEGVSDTQRYKMLGNGWTVNVIIHILKHIKDVE
jgi:DNA (cytosine-5)-methyltransferase 3A